VKDWSETFQYASRKKRHHALKYPTEGFVCLKSLQIIDTVSARKGKEHKGEDHLGIRPSLRWSEVNCCVGQLGKV
jgi:hypothetical protein